MNLGIRAHDLVGRDVVSIAKNLKEININNIQFALAKSIENIDMSQGNFSPGLANYIKGELDKGDAHITVLGCYINPIHPDMNERQAQIDKFKENLKYAKYLGADMVGTETGSVFADCSYSPENAGEKPYQELLETMKILVNDAEKLGVMVGVEAVAMHTLNTPERMKRFLDDINSPNVLCIFDPVNLLDAQNWEDQHAIIDKAFELYSDRMAAVHLKDFDIKDGERYTVNPGKGKFDFDYLFKKFKTTKPYITFLMEEVPSDYTVESLEYLREVYKNA